MLFNSYVFVLFFLPLILAIWWSPRLDVRRRLAVLTLASYFFYGWWDFRFVGLLMLSTVVDYGAGITISRSTCVHTRRLALWISLISNLGLLGFFKYSGFLAQSVNAVSQAVAQADALPIWEIVLPVGISFYTFQTMSYTIDLYRGVAQPASSFLHFAAYVSMFPQLVAGPIVRYADIEDQLRSVGVRPQGTWLARGIYFFALGLGQKILLADSIAARINPLLADTGSLQLVSSWYAMLGYTCQLYFDFAGYSNMAVGLGLLLGFQFPQNFDSPYRATNISLFWRRWHMTLSTWLRDYLFVPLGGSRGSSWRTSRNLLIVMLLGGLWHGAGWTFVVWGGFHGMLLALHRAMAPRCPVRLPTPVAVGFTFLAVVIGWVFFRASDMQMAWSVLGAMFGAKGWEPNVVAACGGVANVGVLSVLLLGVFCLPNVWNIRFQPGRAWAIGLAGLLVLCILRFDSDSPFLYFQF